MKTFQIDSRTQSADDFTKRTIEAPDLDAAFAKMLEEMPELQEDNSEAYIRDTDSGSTAEVVAGEWLGTYRFGDGSEGGAAVTASSREQRLRFRLEILEQQTREARVELIRMGVFD